MFEQLWSGARVITQKRFTSQSIKSMKKRRRNFPKEVYSSTAIRGNGPDLQQRNWKILDSRMCITSLDIILPYFSFTPRTRLNFCSTFVSSHSELSSAVLFL